MVAANSDSAFAFKIGVYFSSEFITMLPIGISKIKSGIPSENLKKVSSEGEDISFSFSQKISFLATVEPIGWKSVANFTFFFQYDDPPSYYR